MKIQCHCGASIIDQTDDLPHKAHLIPDQEWLSMYDAIDNEIINPLADDKLDKAAAYQTVRRIISKPSRLMWQCRTCGRLYIDGRDGKLRYFVPEGENPDREVLRGRQPD